MRSTNTCDTTSSLFNRSLATCCKLYAFAADRDRFYRNHRTVTEAGSIEDEWFVENVVDRVETMAR